MPKDLIKANHGRLSLLNCGQKNSAMQQNVTLLSSVAEYVFPHSAFFPAVNRNPGKKKD